MPSWKSRNRLVADWFAKIRQNETTLEVEHPDVVAVETAATDAVANIDMSTKADATTVYTKAETEAKIAELSPLADWNTLANKPQDLVRYSYTADYHPSNLTPGQVISNFSRVNVGGSCCYFTFNEKYRAGPSFEVGAGVSSNWKVRFRGYRQEGQWRGSMYVDGSRVAYDDRGNGCCWQTLGVGGYKTFTVPAGAHTITPYLGVNIGGVNIWMEYELVFVGWN